MVQRVIRVLAVLGTVFAACAAFAQYASDKVSLLSQIPLATFGSTSGNDCWGYVSGSGREYVVMGLNNKVAVVEVTNPASPVIVGTIPHTSSSWAAIKVYQGYCYVGTEASGSGIQVIDLNQVDSGMVTLVRTITTPGRTHTIAINPASGYFYSCGSREGAGWTCAFDCSNPSNPVRVGPTSLTVNYIHESQVVSYTSGPYAGKEIFFGCSESRGLEIWDFTSKTNPTHIKTISYPNVRYCHQGWLSADRKYFYINDELDENQFLITTRTIVMNVESLENAFYVGSFTSGLAAIDHNLYVHKGFLFESNYKSGLRIFDTYFNPEVPTQVGWFDTYPLDDTRGFSGTWTNYPYLPSGTVAIADINRGLFLVDATVAMTRKIAPTTFQLSPGTVLSGGLSQLATSDDGYLVGQVETAAEYAGFPVALTVSSISPDVNPSAMQFVVESRASDAGFGQSVEMFDWVAGSFVPVDYRILAASDSSASLAIPGPLARFVKQGTREVKARLGWEPVFADVWIWSVFIDEATWRIRP